MLVDGVLKSRVKPMKLESQERNPSANGLDRVDSLFEKEVPRTLLTVLGYGTCWTTETFRIFLTKKNAR